MAPTTYEHPEQSRYAPAFDPRTGQIQFRVTTTNTHLIAQVLNSTPPALAAFGKDDLRRKCGLAVS